MGLIFNRGSSEDGCGQHHYPDQQEYSLAWMHASVTGRSTVSIDIYVPREATCLHDGCDAVDRSHGVTYRVRKDLIQAGNLRAPQRAEKLREMADRIDPEVDDDDE